MGHEKELLLSKDEQIKKLKLAFNIATNPEAQEAVQHAESREQQLSKELHKSQQELSDRLARKQELRQLIAKAEADKDEHHQITYGAELQDLTVKTKRGQLRIDALQVALKQAQSKTQVTDKMVQNAPADAHAEQAMASAAKTEQLDALKEKLKAEESKLEMAKKKETDDESGKTADQPVEEGQPSGASAKAPVEPEAQAVEPVSASPSAPIPSDTENKAKAAAEVGKQLLKASTKTSKAVGKAVKDNNLAESNTETIYEKKLSLLQAELQLQKKENMLLKLQNKEHSRRA